MSRVRIARIETLSDGTHVYLDNGDELVGLHEAKVRNRGGSPPEFELEGWIAPELRQ